MNKLYHKTYPKRFRDFNEDPKIRYKNIIKTPDLIYKIFSIKDSNVSFEEGKVVKDTNKVLRKAKEPQRIVLQEIQSKGE